MLTISTGINVEVVIQEINNLNSEFAYGLTFHRQGKGEAVWSIGKCRITVLGQTIAFLGKIDGQEYKVWLNLRERLRRNRLAEYCPDKERLANETLKQMMGAENPDLAKLADITADQAATIVTQATDKNQSAKRNKPKPQARIQAAIRQLSINRLESIKKTSKVPDLNAALAELGEATISRKKLREHAPDLVAKWTIKSYRATWKYNDEKEHWEVSE